ncbi:MAG TPA: carboxypeptidase-like regulatory domain-containing protein [Candidatus Polarisedimenticolia bacterium]|jgi:hypothetical protein
MNAIRLALAAALLCLVPPSIGAKEEGADEGSAGPGPTAVIAGRVLLKDGVTPVADAEILLSGQDEGEEHVVRTGRRGRYRMHLPAGEYLLKITRGTDLYRAPSSYRVSAGIRNRVDFLLLPDFEPRKESTDDRTSFRRGPDPRPGSPVEVGTVVDIVHAAGGGRLRRWAEILGFAGSLIAVAIASH